ncbi:MAG: glutamine-hydrolyzing carbamoyl-phosphate synthase small subunit [Spirochaetales bacterium]|nr:glutamine-hydrolyzing carbamoyl-phosphate synthase small subunit [Spirochaetales bacterium]
MNSNKGFLLLDDGTVFAGKGFGFPLPKAEELGEYNREERQSSGEVVFNTGMCGYHEILTDPSYTGQIVAMTYPLIGNYGTDDEWSETLSSSVDIKNKIKASGLIIRSLYDGPVTEGRKSLDEYLKENRICGLTEVDTRALTLKIRNDGMPKGVFLAPVNDEAKLLSEDEIAKGLKYLGSFPDMQGRNLVTGQDVKLSEEHNPNGSPHIALVDCGIKENILKQLLERGCRVTVFPHASRSSELLSVNPDCAFFSNGPGDPAVLTPIIDCAGELLGKLPVFGICLGHQIISLALGARTEKMSFGHHGVNNPVRDERSGKVYVTSQNHGFMVVGDSLPSKVDIWFKNANDGTVEGVISDNLKVATAQFHPESAPGPEDTYWIFDEFLKIIGQVSK